MKQIDLDLMIRNYAQGYFECMDGVVKLDLSHQELETHLMEFMKRKINSIKAVEISELANVFTDRYINGIMMMIEAHIVLNRINNCIGELNNAKKRETSTKH